MNRYATQIAVDYQALSGTPQDLSSYFQQSTVAAAADSPTHTLNVSVRYVDTSTDSVTPMINVKGGHALGGSGKSCTSGFTVVRKGVEGVLTARHCGGESLYTDTNSQVSGVVCCVVAATPFPHSWVDAEFLKVYEPPHDAVDKFEASNSETHDVRTVMAGYPSLGVLSCHYGTSGGKGCGYVTDDHLCVTYAGSEIKSCGLYEVGGYSDPSKASVPGDSGGPCYRGHRAMGLLVARAQGRNGYYDDCVTIYWATTKLSASVLTS